jgi:hypothetical protein
LTWMICQTCGGAGRMTVPLPNNAGQITQQCPTCAGRGRLELAAQSAVHVPLSPEQPNTGLPPWKTVILGGCALIVLGLALFGVGLAFQREDPDNSPVQLLAGGLMMACVGIVAVVYSIVRSRELS